MTTTYISARSEDGCDWALMARCDWLKLPEERRRDMDGVMMIVVATFDSLTWEKAKIYHGKIRDEWRKINSQSKRVSHQ